MSIDPSALVPYRTVMGDDADAFVADLIDSYLANSGDLLAGLESAMAGNDTEKFVRSAHTLKSNSAIFGATALSAFCQELETVGKDGNLAGLQAKVGEMKKEYKQVCQELGELRATLPKG
jgi:HPt (histidine-containing phosphotransfer) domain-containing protein